MKFNESCSKFDYEHESDLEANLSRIEISIHLKYKSFPVQTNFSQPVSFSSGTSALVGFSLRHQRMAVFNFVAEVLTINLFNVVFIPAKCNHIVVVYKYKENKVRENDNFPGSKIFGAKTFKIKRVNCIIFQIRDKYE